jgi:light-regulated signal transduction histidine kinase (bacteriophytochrome)
MSGFSQQLTDEFASNLPPEALHCLQRLDHGARTMGILVDELLNLARVNRGDLKLQVVELRSLVNEVIQSLMPESVARRIEWKIGDLPSVECDPVLMKQVFQNLLSNAVKFTRARPHATIEIDQKQENGIHVIYVRDNGVGFSMQHANKLFGVFQRLHRQDEYEGIGVGLATVQRIVQRHGGRVWAEGAVNAGATFYFTIGNAQPTLVQAAAIGGKL